MKRKKARKPFTPTRLKNQFFNLVGNPFNMVVFISLVALVALIVIPLLQMLSETFTLARSELRRVDGQVGDFTLYYWKYLISTQMSNAVLWTPLIHSLTTGFFTALISVPLGSVLAWLMVRSDLPHKKTISMLVIIPYMIPSWTKALSWLAVFRNQRSGALGLLAGMGLNVPDYLAYGPIAIVLVMVMHYYAFSYIMVSGSLRSVNSELEEMAEIQGANKRQILKSITLPLVLPSVLSATIMTLSKSVGSYGVAANLGSRIGYFTLATKMKEFITGTSNKGVGYAMSLLLILLASGTIIANQRLVGSRKSYETMGGKGTRHSAIPLGKAKNSLMAFIVFFLIVSMVIPTFVLVMESFQVTTGGGYGLSNLTLYNYIGIRDIASNNIHYPGIFRNPEFSHALWNTIKLTIIASILTAFSGQFLGYISARGRGKWYGRLTEQLVFVPYLMPGVAFSAIYFAMFGRPLLGGLIPSLYGTFTLIVMVSVVKHFPFASRAGTANMLQIGVELEEAADLAGASFWRRLRSVVIPLAKQGFISGFMLVFISIAKELDLIVILMTPKNRTLSYLAFSYSREGMSQMADAISICVLLFILVCYRIANHYGADIGKSWG
ncbi:MAG: iron ABC transporter permease [Clostridiales bacterium]|jgi:iron(III) transport system permease protein|nr:iron ABC transporter permease [Clostridiales bacterium]